MIHPWVVKLKRSSSAWLPAGGAAVPTDEPVKVELDKLFLPILAGKILCKSNLNLLSCRFRLFVLYISAI